MTASARTRLWVAGLIFFGLICGVEVAASPPLSNGGSPPANTAPPAAVSPSAVAAPSSAVVPSPATPAPGPTIAVPKPEIPVLVVDLPSVLERPNGLLDFVWQGADAYCFDFLIEPAGKPPLAMDITTTGVAMAVLTFDDPRSKCVKDPRGSQSMLHIADLPDTGRHVRLTLQRDSFPDNSAGEKGKVLIVAPGMRAVETAITVRKDEYQPHVKAFLWLLGIAIPAGVVGGIGVFYARYTSVNEAKSKERSDFDEFKRSSRAELAQFFSGLYQNMFTLDDASFRKSIAGELGNLGILGALPKSAMNQIMDSIQRADRAAIQKALAKAFPDFKADILKPGVAS